MTDHTHYIVTRSQPAKHGKSGFAGPDHYMAFVTVPLGSTFDPQVTPLSKAVIDACGLDVRYLGEYYARHTGPRSAYAALRKHAEALLSTCEAEKVTS